MKKVIFFMAVITSLIADITPNLKTIILKSENYSATVKDIDAPIGSSGIVIHYFDKIHSTIVARAELIDKNKIEFKVFDALKQKALPTPNILPKAGDKVILNYLYNRGLIIAPNYKTYKNIIKNHNKIEWLHPDLFAAQLSKEKNPAPTKENFKNFCNRYAVGIIYMAISNKGYFVDCYSFKRVYEEPLNMDYSETRLPFYSRVKEIESSWFNFYGDNEVKDYTNYYMNLMESKW